MIEYKVLVYVVGVILPHVMSVLCDRSIFVLIFKWNTNCACYIIFCVPIIFDLLCLIEY